MTVTLQAGAAAAGGAKPMQLESLTSGLRRWGRRAIGCCRQQGAGRCPPPARPRRRPTHARATHHHPRSLKNKALNSRADLLGLGADGDAQEGLREGLQEAVDDYVVSADRETLARGRHELL